MRTAPKVTILLLVALAAVPPALAQQSASYKLEEHNFNAGSSPGGTASLTSASYLITTYSLADSVVHVATQTSAGYRAEAGFTPRYSPAAEVFNLFLTDSDTLVWGPVARVASYSLYRGNLGTLPSLGYGGCVQSSLASTTANEPLDPPSGDAFFYLVTARNYINEEGTAGHSSDSAERTPVSCP